MFRYDRLDELIMATGKKKSFLSEKMGHAKRYLNDAKKQNSNICDEDVRVLAWELGTSVEYLRGETDDPAQKNPAALPGDGLELEFRKKYEMLTDDQKKLIEQMIDGLLGARGVTRDG